MMDTTYPGFGHDLRKAVQEVQDNGGTLLSITNVHRVLEVLKRTQDSNKAASSLTLSPRFLGSLYQSDIWYDRNGTRTPLEELDDSHLQNCIRFLLHKAVKSRSFRTSIQTGCVPGMAEEWYEEKMRTTPLFKALQIEAASRYLEKLEKP